MEEYTNPKLWGPYFWFMMRCIAFNFPSRPTNSDRKYYSDFYRSLLYVLPCRKCRANYGKLLEKYPVEKFLHSREEIINWVELIYRKTKIEIESNKDQYLCNGYQCCYEKIVCPRCQKF